MKILHFILGKANKDRANGVNQVIAGLAKYSVRHGAEVRVIGKAETVEVEGQRVERDGFSVEVYSRWAQPIYSALAESILWADVVHLHGAYSIWNVLVANMCDKLSRPYVISLHNGLSPELARVRGSFRKKVFHFLLQRRHLERAAGIHVLTDEEGTDVLSTIRPRKIFCIPNGIDLEDYPSFIRKSDNASGSISIGFLGRLSPEKNLEALCSAFANVNIDGNLRLRLAGPESEYGKSLLKRYFDKGVDLAGPFYGKDKDKYISSLDILVIPSLAEGFSISVAESLALGTPLLVTRTSKMAYFYNENAFFMCEPTAFSLEKGLREALFKMEDWRGMADRGRHLIESQLNWSALAAQLLQAYKEIIGSKT